MSDKKRQLRHLWIQAFQLVQYLRQLIMHLLDSDGNYHSRLDTFLYHAENRMQRRYEKMSAITY